MRAVIAEALRLRPVVPLAGRRLQSEHGARRCLGAAFAELPDALAARDPRRLPGPLVTLLVHPLVEILIADQSVRNRISAVGHSLYRQAKCD